MKTLVLNPLATFSFTSECSGRLAHFRLQPATLGRLFLAELCQFGRLIKMVYEHDGVVLLVPLDICKKFTVG